MKDNDRMEQKRVRRSYLKSMHAAEEEATGGRCPKKVKEGRVRVGLARISDSTDKLSIQKKAGCRIPPE